MDQVKRKIVVKEGILGCIKARNVLLHQFYQYADVPGWPYWHRLDETLDVLGRYFQFFLISEGAIVRLCQMMSFLRFRAGHYAGTLSLLGLIIPGP